MNKEQQDKIGEKLINLEVDEIINEDDWLIFRKTHAIDDKFGMIIWDVYNNAVVISVYDLEDGEPVDDKLYLLNFPPCDEVIEEYDELKDTDCFPVWYWDESE